MLRFAWWSLRGRWERIVTLSLGLIGISICTTLLAGFTQLSTLTAVQQVSRAWRAPYDLLVRSPAALSTVERQLQMVDPTGLEQTYGGISLAQVSTIAQIPHVAVAAPEAIVGWVLLRPYVLISFTQPGLYRVTTGLARQAAGSGQERQAFPASTQVQTLFEVLPLPAYTRAANMQGKLTYVPLNASGTATISAFWPLPALLAAVDPVAEARLVGLRWQPAAVKSSAVGGLPLLMDTHPWASLTATVTVERASTPVTLSMNGGSDPPSATFWSMVTRQQFDSHRLLTLLAQELTGQDPQTSAVPLQGGGITRYARVGYALMQSGSANSAPPALSLLSAGADAGGLLTRLPLLPGATTPWVTFGKGGTFATFDAASLPVFSDNNSFSAPLGLYQPEPGEAPLGLSPQHSVASSPPLLITTVKAACALIGEQCISAVRVRVANLGPFGPRSEALLQQVAADIVARTGLHVDVLTGASGQRMTVQVPVGSETPLDFSEIWIQPYAAVTIAGGVNGVNVLLLLWAVSVAALALVAAALLSASSRSSDIAILWRIGWTNRQILTGSAVEAVVTAFLAALPAWALSLLLDRLGAPAVLPTTVLFILGGAVLLYALAVTLATRVNFASRKSAGLRAHSRWSWDRAPWRLIMLLRQISWRRGSATLVALATAGACGLVSIMLLVYRGLDGILYSTLLGQQVQVSLSAIHLITAILTCASAALTADLTVLLMVRERRREFGVLLATGWTGRAVAAEIVREGLALGFLGGLLGGFVAVALFAVGYHVWSPLLFAVCILGAVMLGMALCVLGAIYPAYLAARLSPQQVLTKV